MQVTIVANTNAPHQVQHQEALAEGLAVHGVDVFKAQRSPLKTKIVACWGWRLGKKLRMAGHDVLVMERGYLGDRFKWSSLAFNGLNGRGTFAKAPNDGGARFDSHFSLAPWHTGGDYVLVMGQVPGDASLQGRDLMPWYEQACRNAAYKYGLPVMFRQHPMAIKCGYKQTVKRFESSAGSLDEALSRAALVITYNSNVAVDAVIAGVPAIAVDKGSMAWNVVGHSIGEKLMPDRQNWAHELAWKQWQLSEIANGSALVDLLRIPLAGDHSYGR